MKKTLILILRLLLPVLIIGGCFMITRNLLLTKPPQKTRKPPPTTVTVDVLQVATQNYAVTIHTYGTVLPRTQTTLIPEVSGRIVDIAQGFRAGGFFEKDEALVTLEKQDYITAVEIAKSAVAQAQLRLTEETARAKQAAGDWAKLGKGQPPNALVLREPQLAEAQAKLSAETARLAMAERNLERTRIHAPFAGRVLEQHVDVGQFVSPGAPLAKVYAVDYAEVRLPLSEDQQRFIDLPEKFRHEQNDSTNRPAVSFTVKAGHQVHTWAGYVVRTEGMVDFKSRQLSLVAQIDDPYKRRYSGQPALKMGQFVDAAIEGVQLKGVVVIPRRAIRQDGEVLVIDDDYKIQRRRVEVLWNNRDDAVLREGLKHGERISITPLPFAVDGMLVKPSTGLNPQDES